MREPRLLEKMLTLFQQKGWRHPLADDSAPIRPMCWPQSAPRSACCVSGKRCARRWVVWRWVLQTGCGPTVTPNGWSAMARAAKLRARLWEKLSVKPLRDLIGRQGRALLDALFEPTAPQWLGQVPAVEVVRQVWVQNYQRIDDAVRWRSSENIPPPSRSIGSPYDQEAHYSKKRSTTWVGYKVHLRDRCELHLPLLITHVEPTSAPVSDDAMTAAIHADAAA
jgi:transposase